MLSSLLSHICGIVPRGQSRNFVDTSRLSASHTERHGADRARSSIAGERGGDESEEKQVERWACDRTRFAGLERCDVCNPQHAGETVIPSAET